VKDGGQVREAAQIAGGPPSAVVGAISGLRARPRLSLGLALLALVVVLIVDVLVPGYVIAAAYLVIVMFAAMALTRRAAIAVAVAGLTLTVTVMLLREDLTAGNLLLVWFGVLAGAATFALVALYDSVESLHVEQRRREQDLAFVTELQDGLAQVTSPQGVMDVTGSLLGAYLGVSHVFLADFGSDGDADVCTIWNDQEANPLPGRSRIREYVDEEILDTLRQGKAVTCADAYTDPRTGAEACQAAGLRSWIMAPFRRDGRLTFVFGAAGPRPRDWRAHELELLRDVVVRVMPRLERARAEEALRLSDERFRLIVTTANEGIALSDAEDRVTFVNETLASWLGHAPDEMIGRAAKEFLSPTDLAVQPRRMEERRRGVGAQYDARLRTGDGELRWFLVSAAPVLDDRGEFRGDLAMFTDISERKESEAALALQAHLLANVHDAILALDGSFRITYWNEAAEQLFGWSREEAVGHLSKELLQAVIPDSSWDDARAALLHAGSFRGEVRYRHKDGHELWTDVHSRVIVNDDGATEAVVASIRDIGEQKRAQEALAWEAARLRAIVDAAPVGLGILGADGEVLLRNDVLRNIWAGSASADSPGDHETYAAYWADTGERLRPDDWPDAQALATGRSFADVVVDIDRFDGSRGTIVLSTAPIVDSGDILGAVTIVQDITSLRDAEQALRFLTEEVRSLHEAVVLDRALSSVELASVVVLQAGILLGSDGSSIFLLDEKGSLRPVAGVGEPDPAGLDDLVAEAIGDRVAVVREVAPPPGEPSAPGRLLLAVPLLLRDTVFGAMGFAYEKRRSLGDTELRIARAFADQAALAIENARLRARIEESAVEAERTRLARDLHDSVTQSLFAASLKAEVLADLVGRDSDKAKDAVEELRRLTRGALAGMRTMLLEMRADGLTQTPLPELVRHLVEASGSRIGADVRLRVEGARTVPPEVQTAFYRITQEALNNVARHAKARSVCVDLSLSDEMARLEVGDDGVGFDRPSDGAGHFGLRNMRERAEAIGAHFTVVSGSGRGTVVTVKWPFGEGEAHDD
jgi:PAS domain S-box-containing protein